MAERPRQFERLAQIVVIVDPECHLDEEDFSTRRLIARLEEDREELTADLSLAFEPMLGTLIPGELQIREGSVHIILEILGNAAQWAAVTAGIWQLLEYLRGAAVGRVGRFLARNYGLHLPLSGVVVPVAVLPAVGVEAARRGEGTSRVQTYLLATHGLLLAWAIAVSLILLLHVL
jgi:hypothetical protein